MENTPLEDAYLRCLGELAQNGDNSARVLTDDYLIWKLELALKAEKDFLKYHLASIRRYGTELEIISEQTIAHVLCKEKHLYIWDHHVVFDREGSNYHTPKYKTPPMFIDKDVSKAIDFIGELICGYCAKNISDYL